MDTSLGRIRLSEQIEESIMGAIRSGEFPPGSKLPSERTLMEMFEVGRPSVKEALLMLERKGFVRLKRGVAPIVVEPTPQGALDSIADMVGAMLADENLRSEFYDLRIMLETAASFEAAANCEAHHLQTLEAALEACRVNRGNAKGFRDADRAFHAALVAVTGNSVVCAFHHALIDWGLFNPETGPNLEAIHQRVVEQHTEIVDSIKRGDREAAAEALRDHLLTRRDAVETP